MPTSPGEARPRAAPGEVGTHYALGGGVFPSLLLYNIFKVYNATLVGSGIPPKRYITVSVKLLSFVLFIDQ